MSDDIPVEGNGSCARSQEDDERISTSSSSEDGSSSFDERALSLQEMESQVVSSLMATLENRSDKSRFFYRSPLPFQRQTPCLFPCWMVISIVILSLIGILGAIFEMLFQFQRM